MTLADTPTVLIVDDEPSLTSLYATWLGDQYDVRIANNGREALEAFDDTVDVVLLDRRMPDLDGTEVLEQLGKDDTDCKVAMVTAVEPSCDVMELGFDDYVVKPVDQSVLAETVEALITRREYSAVLQEYFQLVSKQATLAATQPSDQLRASGGYQRHASRIEQIQSEVDLFGDLDPADFEAAMRSSTQSHLELALNP